MVRWGWNIAPISATHHIICLQLPSIQLIEQGKTDGIWCSRKDFLTYSNILFSVHPFGPTCMGNWSYRNKKWCSSEFQIHTVVWIMDIVYLHSRGTKINPEQSATDFELKTWYFLLTIIKYCKRISTQMWWKSSSDKLYTAFSFSLFSFSWKFASVCSHFRLTCYEMDQLRDEDIKKPSTFNPKVTCSP